jgi:hypothetical protein
MAGTAAIAGDDVSGARGAGLAASTGRPQTPQKRALTGTEFLHFEQFTEFSLGCAIRLWLDQTERTKTALASRQTRCNQSMAGLSAPAGYGRNAIRDQITRMSVFRTSSGTPLGSAASFAPCAVLRCATAVAPPAAALACRRHGTDRWEGANVPGLSGYWPSRRSYCARSGLGGAQPPKKSLRGGPATCRAAPESSSPGLEICSKRGALHRATRRNGWAPLATRKFRPATDLGRGPVAPVDIIAQRAAVPR